jgi:hypothetical protein
MKLDLPPAAGSRSADPSNVSGHMGDKGPGP